MHGTVLLSVLALALITTPSLRAADRVTAGQWELTSTVNGEAKTNSYCLTPAQAKGINGNAQVDQDFLERSALIRHCTIKDFKLEGSTLSYTKVCAGYTVSERTTYSGDTSEGESTTTMDGQEAVVTTVKGRRLGDCK